MNDKQLALLLRQIAGRVRALAAEVEPLITVGEEVAVNVGFNWKPIAAPGKFPLQPEPIEITRLAAVQRILDLAEDLADEAELIHPAQLAAEPAD
ncbi:MAG: hypothetical protein R3C43_04895 [Chloroflexota bacterium]